MIGPGGRRHRLRALAEHQRDDGVDGDDPPPEKARCHFLAGTLPEVGPVLGWALGDGLVRVCSATPELGLI